MISSILKILSSLASWFSNKQLLDAGEAKAENKILRNNAKMVSDAKKINNRNDNANDVRKRMRKRNGK